jgi:hypothetical protein
MPITQEMLDKLDPAKRQQAMQLMEQLKQGGVDVHSAYDNGGVLPQAQPSRILPQNNMSAVSGLINNVGGSFLTGINRGVKPANDTQTEINNFLAKEQAKIKLQQMEDAQDPVKQLARKNAEFELGQGGISTTDMPIEMSAMDAPIKEPQVSGPQRYIADPSKISRLNPKGLVPNTGYEKQIEDTNRKKQMSEDVKASASSSLKTIAEVEKGMGYFGAGSLIPAIPSLQSEKVNWEANVNQLLAQKVLDTMNKMKSASKTGATGFGALNAKELKKLEDASTALKKTMSPKDAQRYINDMKASLQKIASGGGNIEEPMDERSQAKQILIEKGYDEQEAEQLLGQ